MKYAFVFGTAAFIIPQNIIRYANEDRSKEILRVNSAIRPDRPESVFSINLDIKDAAGNVVRVTDNKAESEGSYTVSSDSNSLTVLNADGSLLIKVHQLDWETAMGLEHNIVAEFEVNAPLAVFRINGDFMAEDLHITAENEKLFVNDDDWATAALAGESLRFTADGVII
jgi:hypothetical protein